MVLHERMVIVSSGVWHHYVLLTGVAPFMFRVGNVLLEKMRSLRESVAGLTSCILC